MCFLIVVSHKISLSSWGTLVADWPASSHAIIDRQGPQGSVEKMWRCQRQETQDDLRNTAHDRGLQRFATAAIIADDSGSYEKVGSSRPYRPRMAGTRLAPPRPCHFSGRLPVSHCDVATTACRVVALSAIRLCLQHYTGLAKFTQYLALTMVHLSTAVCFVNCRPVS